MSRRSARAFTVAGLVFAMVACSDSSAPDSTLDFLAGRPEGALRTDQSSYTAVSISGEPPVGGRYAFQVIATFENRLPRTLYLARCYPDSRLPVFGVVMEPDGGSAFDQVWACVGHDQQIAVRPGETRTDTLYIQGPNGWDGRTGVPFGLLEGRMRIQYYPQSCRGDGECRVGAFVSAPFTVQLEP